MLMLLSASGRGKRISLSAFKQQTRAGRGKRGMGLLKGDAVAAMCVTGFCVMCRSNGSGTEKPEACNHVCFSARKEVP